VQRGNTEQQLAAATAAKIFYPEDRLGSDTLRFWFRCWLFYLFSSSELGLNGSLWLSWEWF